MEKWDHSVSYGKKKKENTAAGRKYYTRYGPIRIKLWLLTSIQGSKTSFT